MRDLNKYKGIIPAFYACYDENGEISPERVRELTEFHIKKGVKGLYVNGSSGECIYLSVEDRKVVLPARERAAKLKEENAEICTAVAMELEDGVIVTGKGSQLLDASAAALLNSIKYLANIADDIHLISPVILQPILDLKSKTLGNKKVSLNCEEVLIALSISVATNPTAQVAMDKLAMLKGAQAHSVTILPTSDEQTFRKLGIDVTCDAEYASESLFYND